jgi:hypothetical protein
MFQMERAIRSGFFTLAAAEAPRIRKTARHTIQRLSRIARYKYRYQPGKPSKMNFELSNPNDNAHCLNIDGISTAHQIITGDRQMVR